MSVSATIQARGGDWDGPRRVFARAARLLAGRYTLVATNVPYLGRRKQCATLANYSDLRFPEGRGDLATTFLLRCLGSAHNRGSIALVLPQNWLFSTSYERLRKRLLDQLSWNWVARLGAGAFRAIGGEVVQAILLMLDNAPPTVGNMIAGLDVHTASTPEAKIVLLRELNPAMIAQDDQARNPDCRITLETEVSV